MINERTEETLSEVQNTQIAGCNITSTVGSPSQPKPNAVIVIPS